MAAEVNVTPSNWNDQKTKITGYTAPGNKYFATKQRLAYHPEAKKFGTWINDAPASGQAKAAPPPPPPPPPQPEPQASGQSTSSGSDGKSKQEQLEDYEKDYLARLEQKKIDDAKAAAEEAAAEAKAAAAASAAKSSQGTLPKGFSPPKPAEEPKPASRGTLPKGF